MRDRGLASLDCRPSSLQFGQVPGIGRSLRISPGHEIRDDLTDADAASDGVRFEDISRMFVDLDRFHGWMIAKPPRVRSEASLWRQTYASRLVMHYIASSTCRGD
jgi:hypothetical protein